jgi:hypothetical protein
MRLDAGLKKHNPLDKNHARPPLLRWRLQKHLVRLVPKTGLDEPNSAASLRQ